MAVTTKFLAAGHSDPGRKRSNNEDRFWIDTERGIFLVVDGVGGQAAGETAAETAVAMLKARLERQVGSTVDRVREGITLANNEIFRMAESKVEWHGMACVLTVAVVEDGRVTVGHVGDSRLYLLQGGRIRKVTHDHSPVGEREDAGELNELEAMQHPRRNEVFRDVGSEEHTPQDADFIEIVEAPFPPEAALLLCSDGLSDMIPSTEMQRLIEQHAEQPRQAVRALVEAANEAGGKDNVTVVLVQGPQFAAAPRRTATLAVAAAKRPANWGARLMVFLLGLALGAGLMWFLRRSPAGEVAAGGEREWRVGLGESINATLAKARPGDTVIVPPKLYPETVRLTEGVTLVSEQPREATIQGAILVEGVKVGRVQGFRVDASGQPVGILLADTGITVEDTEVLGAHAAGVEFRGSSTATLLACRIHANLGAGIVIQAGTQPRLIHNVVTNNGRNPRQPRPGIQMLGFVPPLMFGNNIWDNGAEAIWHPAGMPDGEMIRQNFFGVVDSTAGKRRVRVVSP